MNDRRQHAVHSKRARPVAGTVLASLSLAVAPQAHGQDIPLINFGLSFGGEYTANDPGEDETRFTTGLGFDLRKSTDAQSFVLSADGSFLLDEAGITFEQPRLELDYARANRSTSFDAGLSFSVRDVEGQDELIDPVTGDIVDLVDDDGTLETLGLTLGLQTGLDARVGTDTQFSYTSRTYSGTSDPDLTDLESWQIGSTLSLEVDPRITLRTSGSYRELAEDNDEQTQSRTVRHGIGADLQIDPLWAGSIDLRYAVFETEERISGVRTVTESDGLGFSLGLSRQFRDGSLALSLDRTESDDGAEDSLTLSRARSLANGGAWNWSLGLVAFPNGDVAPVASASYTRPTPRGRLAVSLAQSTSANDEDGNVISTSFGVNYVKNINAVSSWSLDGSFSNVNALGSEEEDQTRAVAGISYNHALTRDWRFAASLRHRITYEGGEEQSNASTLSMSLQRSFSFRP